MPGFWPLPDFSLLDGGIMTSRRFRVLMGLLLVAFLLVSCQAGSPASSVAEGNQPQTSGSSADEGSEVGEPNQAQASDASAAEEPAAAGPHPEPRTELTATNPGRVKLGSGRVTLVEFFAFW
jgi:hypothetical protein